MNFNLRKFLAPSGGQNQMNSMVGRTEPFAPYDFRSRIPTPGQQIIPTNKAPEPEMPMISQQPEEKFQTPQLDAYSQHVAGMPQRGNNTFWQKLAAALAGGSTGYKQGAGAGMEVTQSYLDLPYQRRMQEWMAKGEGLKDTATLENRNIGQENQQLKTMLGNQLGNKKVDSTERVGMASVEQRREAAKQRTDAITARLNKTEWMSNPRFITEEGNPYVINKSTGEERVLPISVYNATEEQIAAAMERAELASATSMRNTDVTAATSRANNADSITGRANLQEDDQQFKLENPDLNTSQKPNNAWENTLDQRDLQQIVAADPSLIDDKIITITSNGKYIPVAPGTPGMFGGDKTGKYQSLITEMDKRRASRNTPKISARPASAPKPKPANSGPARFTVPGRPGIATIPANEIAEFMKAFPNAVRQ